MKSVRLNAEQERLLEEAARRLGLPVSRVIRDAIDEHCRQVLGGSLEAQLSDYTGAMDLGGGVARKTGQEFKRLLGDRQAGRRRA